jgi:hypothetical protein
MSNGERELKIQQLEEARRLKKNQERSRSKFDFLKNVSTKNFQAEYVKAQAEEICRYLKDISLTPLNPWYSELYNMISKGDFMTKFYITFNEYGIAEPDYAKIETLILPEPSIEDFPRGTIILAGS